MNTDSKQPIAAYIDEHGISVFIMPCELDPKQEQFVFLPKVRIIGNLTINPGVIAGPFNQKADTPKE